MILYFLYKLNSVIYINRFNKMLNFFLFFETVIVNSLLKKTIVILRVVNNLQKSKIAIVCRVSSCDEVGFWRLKLIPSFVPHHVVLIWHRISRDDESITLDHLGYINLSRYVIRWYTSKIVQDHSLTRNVWGCQNHVPMRYTSSLDIGKLFVEDLSMARDYLSFVN